MAMFLKSVLAVALGVTFSVASGDNSTNATTTVMTTTTMGTTDTTTAETSSRIVVSGCTELGGAVDQLVGNSNAVTAFTKAIATVAQVPEAYVQNVVFTVGATCGGRRLSEERRLQTAGTVNFDLVFPASLGTAEAQQAATAAITNWGAATQESFVQALTTELAAAGLSSVTITVTNLGTLQTTESGGTTAAATSTLAGETPSAACQTSMALGLLALTQFV